MTLPMPTVAEEVASHGWYHTLELPGGVVTPGLYDTRRAAKKSLLPESLAGKRCLDIGTADGFWAFEMERRGAAEVVAIDLVDSSRRDTTRGARIRIPEGEASRQSQTFALAHRVLESKVEWRNLSVYDLSPEEIGTFDLVFMGSILVHLRDPVLALSTVRSVVRGELLNYEAISLWLSAFHPFLPAARMHGLKDQNWWHPNLVCLRRWLEAAGFDIEQTGGITFVRTSLKTSMRAIRRQPLRKGLLAIKGIPQAWVLSRPST